MSRSRLADPDFGTREEDWPDPDVDSDTSEGRQQNELLDDAMFASINRSIASRNQRPLFPDIPESLYEKAAAHQDQLTDQERQRLLSRGDLVGKVLGDANSLTMEEIHDFLQWPAPNIVQANIQDAIGGACSTPTELYAKFKAVLDSGRKLEEAVSEAELVLPARQFHALNDKTYNDTASLAMASIKGHNSATDLLFSRLGLDKQVLQASCVYTLQRQMPEAKDMMAAVLGSMNAVPMDVNLRIDRMRREPFEKHFNGTISDAEFASSIREHIAGLTAAVGPPPIQDAPLRNLVESLTKIWQDEEQGTVSFAASKKHHWNALTEFDDARIGHIFKDDMDIFMEKETQWLVDQLGSNEWPPGSCLKASPFRLFCNAEPWHKGLASQRAWSALPEDRRVAYRKESEAMRLAAWEHHRANPPLVIVPQPPLPRPEPLQFGPLTKGKQAARDAAHAETARRLRPKREYMTGLLLFQRERYPDMGTMDVLARLEELPKAERQKYTDRANQMNAERHAMEREEFRQRRAAHSK